MGAKKFFSFLSSYDPITLAYVNGMTTKPSTAFIQVIDKYFVKNKKTVNGVVYTAKQLIAKADVIYLGNINNSNDSFRNLVKNAHHGTIQGSGLVFDPYWGWTNPAGTGYVDTNYNPSTQGVNYTQNKAGYGVYKFNSNINDVPFIISSYDNTNQAILRQASFSVNGAAIGVTIIPFLDGLFCARRTASNAAALLNQNAANNTGTTASTVRPNNNFILFRLQAVAPSGAYLRGLNFTYIGASLTDDEFTALNLIVNEYLKECLYLKYGSDNWGVNMAKSYFDTLHNFEPYEAWEIYEFIKRMQPDYVDGAGTGYYYNTFGPSGQNKTVADFIILFKAGGNLQSNSITKTGSVPRWNQSGTITSNASAPAYTRGTNIGIITVSSTDGFNSMTAMSLIQAINSVNSYYGNFPLLYKIKSSGLMSLDIHNNRFKVNFTNNFPLMNSFAMYDCSLPGYLKLSLDSTLNSDIQYLVYRNGIKSVYTGNLSALVGQINGRLAFYSDTAPPTEPTIRNDNLTGSLGNMTLPQKTTGFQLSACNVTAPTATFSKYLTLFSLHTCKLTLASVNGQLSVGNTYFAVNTPINNLDMNLSGTTNAIPTGGSNNTDLLGIVAKFAAVGKTATITVRTS